MSLLKDPPPVRAYIQQVSPYRWRSWVENGYSIYERENGTYSWTRKRAEAKALKLYAKFTAKPAPKIEVAP